MPHAVSSFRWPVSAVPVVRAGGRFPMLAHNPGLEYRSPQTVAVHLNYYTGKFWLGKRAMRLQPGDFTLTPARMASHYDLDAPGHHLCIHFEAQPPGREAFALPLHWRPGPHEQRLAEHFQEAIHLFTLGQGQGPAATLARRAAGTELQSLLLWIAVTVGERRTLAAPTRVDKVLDDVRRSLDEHYREPLDVPALAKRVGVSQNYLSRQFRTQHGMTMQRYVMGRRIELARHLLAVTSMPLKAIAVEAGLSNPQYFHRQFRRATGRGPAEERRRVTSIPMS